MVFGLVLQRLAIGIEPIGYFWLKDDVLLPDATNTTLVLSNIQAGNGGSYAAVASNHFGAATSLVATLTVDSRPLILTEPGDVTVAPGATTNLSVVADGPALNSVWLHNELLIPDATNARSSSAMRLPARAALIRSSSRTSLA